MKIFPKRRLSEEEAIEARAAAWIAQRDEGFNESDEEAFAKWCAADPRNTSAVARLETAWAALSELRNYRPAARAHPDRDLLAPTPTTTGRHRTFPTWVIGTAAIAAAIALVFTWRWSTSPVRPPSRTNDVYTTTVGGYQRLTLVDGSVLELNDSSEVRVHFTTTERRVQLVNGQAHFTVAKDSTKPFFVETTDVSIRAVGTAFDVRLGGNEVEVLVTEGLVQLDRTQVSERRSAETKFEPSMLGAGWRAVVPHEPTHAIVKERVPTDRLRETLSWQGPRLVFVETPLAEVVAQFNRRNPVQISLGDEELASLPVGGSFRAENVESFVRLLASNGDIVVERPAPDRIVLHKAR